MTMLVNSPNAPRPTGITLEIADTLAAIERNYGREGSGPGTRFEGRLLEDVQAEAVLRCISQLAESEADKIRANTDYMVNSTIAAALDDFAELLTGEGP